MRWPKRWKLRGIFWWLVLGWALMGCGSRESSTTPASLPPPAVVVAPVRLQTVPLWGEYVARTEAKETVQIRSRVDGYLEKVLFKEGSQVKVGQLLFVIDQRPYRAALQEARGSLAQAQANLGKALKDVARLKPLVVEDAAPKMDLDNAEAAVDYGRAAVERAKAAIAKAELDLKFTVIRAPINGIIGKAEVTVGNLVTRDQTLLATLSSWDPMQVVFSISEADFLRQSQRFPGGSPFQTGQQAAPFELVTADNAVYPFPGRLNFVDRALNPTTGTLNVYVVFPNPQRLLRPGLFGRVRVMQEERPNALLIPQRAVQVMQGVPSVLVVDRENRVAQRTVVLGERHQDFFIVKEGLQPGEQVVVEGLQRAIPGQQVAPRPAADLPAGKGG